MGKLTNWYLKRKKDQLIILKEINNSYKHIQTVLLDSDKETIKVDIGETTKEIRIRDNAFYWNKFNKLVYFFDFEKEKFINPQEIDLDYDPISLGNIEKNNIAKSIIKVFGEDISENQKLLLIVCLIAGYGLGFISYSLMLQFM